MTVKKGVTLAVYQAAFAKATNLGTISWNGGLIKNIPVDELLLSLAYQASQI